MSDVRFRLLVDNEAADQERLDLIEEIVVEQEVDMAWEARIKMPLRVDARGTWSDEDEGLSQAFSRLRVEIQLGEEPFVPLIDGPVVGHENSKSSRPGESTLTVIVQDDSVYLNRQANVENLGDKSDHEVAAELFGAVEQIAGTDIEDTPPPDGDIAPDLVQHGTAISLLRRLARCQGMHVYVLPGDESGQSVACFKKFPTDASDLPDMILLGKDQNITAFNLSNNGQGATRARTFSFNISDKGAASGTSSFRDLELLGPQESTTQDQAATAIERAGLCRRVPAERRAQVRTERDSYTLQATGQVLEGCYHGVLTPYHIVKVKAVNGRESGNYLIKKVTHTLGRSRYDQAFTLISNALSEGAESGVADLVGSIV